MYTTINYYYQWQHENKVHKNDKNLIELQQWVFKRL